MLRRACPPYHRAALSCALVGFLVLAGPAAAYPGRAAIRVALATERYLSTYDVDPLPRLPAAPVPATTDLGVTWTTATLTTSMPAATPATKLRVRATVLTRTGPATWEGAALSPQLGAGRLTVVGKVAFLSKPDADPVPGVLRFRAVFARGWLRGCLRNSVYLRPGNREVWDGPGRVTRTSASLRRYRGLKVHDGGMTPVADLTRATPFAFSTHGTARDPDRPC